VTGFDHVTAELGGGLRLLDAGLRLLELGLELLEPPVLVEAHLLLVQLLLPGHQDLGIGPATL
jgi:hypothetical protein